MVRDLSVSVVAIAALAVVVTPGTGGAQNACVAAKLKAIGKYQAAKLGCEAKTAMRGDPGLLTACLARAESKFTAAFADAEEGGACSGTGSACACLGDACVAAVRGTLPDAGPSTCEAARLKAAAKKGKGIFGCNAKAAAAGTTVDPACVAKAKERFSRAFAKTAGCTGDEEVVEGLVDNRCIIRMGADAFGFQTVGNICTASCGVVPVPPCATEGAGCGSCGDGVCVSHCPGGDLVCLSNGNFNSPGCTADGQCPAVGDVCGAYGVSACGSGVLNGCSVPCP